MSHLSLYTKLNALPAEMKAEVNDFIDFLIAKRKNKSDKKKPKFGAARGKLKITPDFDEPLDDFKEYMQ